jgi:diguanylate cyclase (GGDEF)-like protein/PAS domain S-box-containing protein
MLVGLILIDLLTRRHREESYKKNENTHENGEMKYRRFIENIKKEYFFYAHDQQGIFTYVSPAIRNILGYSQEEFKDHYTKYLTDNPINEEAKQCTESNLSGKTNGSSYELEIFHKNKNLHLLEVTEFPIFDNHGCIVGIEGIAHDVTEHKKAEENIHRLSQGLDQCSVAIIITDTEGNIEYANRQYRVLNNLVDQSLQGQKPRVLKWGNMSDEQNKELWETIIKGNEWHGEFENKDKDDNSFWEHVNISPIKDKKGKISHFLVLEEDITLEKEFKTRLAKKTNYDELTGLPNRTMAIDRLSNAIELAKREKHAVAVMYIDLDQFKTVNDSLGHAVGDRLVIEASKRLIDAVRKSDTVARIGGDEFLIILPVLDAVTQLSNVAQKVLESFSKPFHLNGHELHVTASIGLTTYPSDGITAEVLLRNADAAMFKAKETTRNTFCFYTNEMNEQAVKRMKMEYHLRHALERNELYIEYQPLIELNSGKPKGVEALVRWKSGELGRIGPMDFIPLAEDIGVINQIGEWVLKEACKQTAKWNQKLDELSRLSIAVNVSSRQFKDGNLLEVVKKALEESQLQAQYLELEITENLLLDDDNKTLSILKQLHGLGVRLSVDDFGTGYSSLSYLKKFPVDTLKIDSSFVQDIASDVEDEALTKAIIAMAHSLGLIVVGEGVETKEQLDFLKKEGCDVVQGYYFSRPVSSKGLKEFLSSHNAEV